MKTPLYIITRLWLLPMVVAICCLMCMQCFLYSREQAPPDREKLPPKGYVLDNLIGTWHWLKPEGSPVTFEVYITFSPDGTFTSRRSLGDTAEVVTTYEVRLDEALLSNRPVYVIQAKNYAKWELISITPDTLKVALPAFDAYSSQTYERVGEE